MDIHVTLPAGKRVDVEVGGHVVRTDQSIEHGGNDSAPEPFDLFLASLGACAGAYVLSFCQAREIPTHGIELRQRQIFDPTSKALIRVELRLMLPADFPDKYRSAVLRAAAGCKVKKALSAPPEVVVLEAAEFEPAHAEYPVPLSRGPLPALR